MELYSTVGWYIFHTRPGHKIQSLLYIELLSLVQSSLPIPPLPIPPSSQCTAAHFKSQKGFCKGYNKGYNKGLNTPSQDRRSEYRQSQEWRYLEG